MNHFPNFIRTKDNLSGNFIETNKKFLFHHIPKTAGSTLRGILETLFDKDEICDAETVQELNNVSLSQFRNLKFFAGHFSYGAINKFLSDAVWITFLREPNERIISQYFNHISYERIPQQWIDRINNNPEWQSYMNEIQGCSLEDWVLLDNKYSNRITCNRQTQAFLPQNLRTKVDDWSIYDKELIEVAKNNLTDRFHFFGIQEFFDLSLNLFSVTFGLPSYVDLESFSTNINSKKKFGSKYKIEENLSKKIRSRNLMDWELYNFAKEKFFENLNNNIFFLNDNEQNNHSNYSKVTEKNYQNHPLGNNKSFASLIQKDRYIRNNNYFKNDYKEYNSFISHFFKKKWKIQSLYGRTGFYQLEKTFYGKKFMWTGAGKTTTMEVNCMLKKDFKYKVEIGFAAVIDKSIIDSLDIIINGLSVNYEISFAKYFWLDSKMTFSYVPKKDYHFNIIEMKSLLKMEDYGNINSRKLGFALTSIKID